MNNDPTLHRCWLAFIAFLMLSACGGGGGGGDGGSGTPSANAPTISNLSYSPQAAYVSNAGLVFWGELDYADPDGDLASLTLVVKDASGATVSSENSPIVDVDNSTSGTIQGSVDAVPLAAGQYTIEIFVTDAAGLRSNVLGGPVRIADFPWTTKVPGPTKREYAAAASLGGKVYLLGGQLTDTGTTPGPATSVVEIYDPATDSWSVAPPMPTARMGLVAATFNGKLYAIGGATDGFSVSAVAIVEEFDPATQTWTQKAPMPTARAYAAGAQAGGVIVVAGGEVANDLLDKVEAYDPLTDTWSARAPLPTARKQLAAVGANGRLYTIGGYAGLQSRWVGVIEEFDPTTNAWTVRPPSGIARSLAAAANVDGKLLVAGGENFARALDVLESFDTASNAWRTRTASPVPFTRGAAGAIGDKVYFFGNGVTLQYAPANDIL